MLYFLNEIINVVPSLSLLSTSIAATNGFNLGFSNVQAYASGVLPIRSVEGLVHFKQLIFKFIRIYTNSIVCYQYLELISCVNRLQYDLRTCDFQLYILYHWKRDYIRCSLDTIGWPLGKSSFRMEL